MWILNILRIYSDCFFFAASERLLLVRHRWVHFRTPYLRHGRRRIVSRMLEELLRTRS